MLEKLKGQGDRKLSRRRGSGRWQFAELSRWHPCAKRQRCPFDPAWSIPCPSSGFDLPRAGLRRRQKDVEVRL